MPLRAPSSTLFPYTTLFRSPMLDQMSERLSPDERVLIDRYMAAFDDADVPGLAELLREEDRKSTRLNSSHLGISYAVFCLKKKRTPKRQRHDWQQCAPYS